MPNFFWNKRKPSVAKITATIEKIHSEFDSASEKLLKEAKEIIAKNSSASKGDRLKSLGFSNLEMEAFKLRNEEKERRTNVDDYYARQRYFAMAQAQSRFGGLGETMTTLRQEIRRQPTYSPPTEVTEYFVQPPFKICAPEKDFDTRFMVKKDGYKLEYDPIVLQPVKGGYLCVTKWGIEASDEIVTNPISN